MGNKNRTHGKLFLTVAAIYRSNKLYRPWLFEGRSGYPGIILGIPEVERTSCICTSVLFEGLDWDWPHTCHGM